ncbi:MAG: nitrogen fixation negative regulator NifL [Pseudomonadota bacterium]
MSGCISTKSCLELQNILSSYVSSLAGDLPPEVQQAVEMLSGCRTAMLPPSLFFEVVEQSAVAISITDTKANILYANPAFNRVTGYSNDEVLGKNESLLSDRNTPAIVYETMWGRLLQQKPWTGILINRRKNNERYLADLTIAPVMDSKGVTTHYLGLHRDVTEVERLQQLTKNQKALIESVVNAATVAIVLLNEQGDIVLDNLTYKAYASETKSELAFDLLAAIKHNLGDQYEVLKRRNGSFKNQQISFHTAGQLHGRWFNCSGTWFSEKGFNTDEFFAAKKQTYLLLVANDITHIKRQEDEIRVNTMRALLAEEEMNQGIRETLLGAIYQMQEPSNLIQAATETLRRRLEGDEANEPLLAVLQQARESSQRAIETLKQCLPASQEREEFRVLNINELLRDILALSTERMLALGITVEWMPTSVLPQFNGQDKRLHSMFKHLIDNAMDAIEYGPRHGRELRVKTEGDDQVIRVIIEDSGPGIPAQLRLKVFEPFFTTRDHRSKAAGMGLTIVQDVITDHFGTVTFDPEYTQGCRVYVELPIRRDEQSFS